MLTAGSCAVTLLLIIISITGTGLYTGVNKTRLLAEVHEMSDFITNQWSVLY